MPVILLERLPLPSLQTYTSFSFVLVACILYYAHDTVVNPGENLIPSDKNDSKLEFNVPERNRSLTNEAYLSEMFTVLTEEPGCAWIMINLAYCLLINLGKELQKAVFGNLRVSEKQHLKDKFWNFVFYKFIFVFGVLNVQHMDEVIMWCGWFSILAFLHLFAQLCKDRFEYLSFSPTTPKWTHVKVLLLLVGIFLVCSGLVAVSVLMGIWVGINTFAFMVAECILLIIRTIYSIIRYAVHLWDLNHTGTWENKANYAYYSELICELTALVVDGLHHIHMMVHKLLYHELPLFGVVRYALKTVLYLLELKFPWFLFIRYFTIWSNIFLSMASLVICMQLRFLFYEFQRRIRRHKNYLKVISSMEARFPISTADELTENDDDCAICWDKMETARKLPCGHLFHNSCLRSWLEQDTSCPTCRVSLGEAQAPPNNNNDGDGDGDGDGPNVRNPVPPAARPSNRTINHFFHFDGSRYVSWLPSFSVEVTHTHLGNRNQASTVHTSQMDNMVRQVQELFPHLPAATLTEDLHSTRSVEATIENILEGRLQPPAAVTEQFLNASSSESDLSDYSDAESSSVAESEGENVPSTSLGYFDDSNVPNLNQRDLSLEEEDTRPDFSTHGGRFSKSSEERESMLEKRKRNMVEIAKKKYLAKQKVTDTETSQNTDT